MTLRRAVGVAQHRMLDPANGGSGATCVPAGVLRVADADDDLRVRGARLPSRTTMTGQKACMAAYRPTDPSGIAANPPAPDQQAGIDDQPRGDIGRPPDGLAERAGGFAA
jgi:hypothetical protein